MSRGLDTKALQAELAQKPDAHFSINALPKCPDGENPAVAYLDEQLCSVYLARGVRPANRTNINHCS